MLTLALLLAAAPEAMVTTLDGDEIAGPLESIGSDSVTVDGQEIAASDLEIVTLPDAVRQPIADAGLVVTLRDGSVIALGGLARAGRQTTLSLDGTELTVPTAEVQAVRLKLLDEKTAGTWQELVDGDRSEDLLVVRKGDKLDFIGCIVGDLTESQVAVRVGSRDLKLPREKAFGVVFAKANTPSRKPRAIVTLADGSRLATDAVAFDGQSFEIAVAAATLRPPADGVVSIDFAQGRIVRLATLEPRVSYERKDRVFSGVRPYRVGQNVLGLPPQVGSRTDPASVWMHSGTTAIFPLPRGAARLQATAGIDEIDDAELPAQPVRVAIRGDGRPIWSGTLQPEDPQRLDVELGGARQLTIEVDGDSKTGIREHLVLLGAKVLTE